MKRQESELFDVIFREKPALMLINLKNTAISGAKTNHYASNLAKSVDCTYSHVVKVLKMFEKHNLVRFEKKGRLKILTLTEKGSQVAEHLSSVRNLMS
ncbi:MAG: hypothetical protein ACMXYL_03200 [Candidatus Woesearchaeota archaeon]